MIIHLPVLIITYKLGIQDIGIRLLLTGILGFGSAAIFARTGNIASSVLLHMLWSWPIVLFR
jgi:membrane protease YdiL (CAAX protease family)